MNHPSLFASSVPCPLSHPISPCPTIFLVTAILPHISTFASLTSPSCLIFPHPASSSSSSSLIFTYPHPASFSLSSPDLTCPSPASSSSPPSPSFTFHPVLLSLFFTVFYVIAILLRPTTLFRALRYAFSCFLTPFSPSPPRKPQSTPVLAS